MKIIFICGSLEPGKDGVGDYTRCLAGELIRQGHQCAILALVDKFIIKEKFETQKHNDNFIEVLRLPFVNGFRENIKNSKKWIDTINPHWISFQYVPYAFHNKGIPINLSKSLVTLTRNYYLQIIFHETWIGISKTSTTKHKVIGHLQKIIAKNLIKICKPKSVLTTNRLYEIILKNENISTFILPLFSSIDKEPFDVNFYNETLEIFSIKMVDRKKWKFIGIFGTLYPNLNLEDELEKQLQKAATENLEIAFISIGRIGNSGAIEFKKLETIFKSRIKFILIGEVNETKASLLLQMLDIVISCTPALYIGKSSVYALLKLHDLQVILLNMQVAPEYMMLINDWNDAFAKRPAHEWSVQHVSNTFLKYLEN